MEATNKVSRSQRCLAFWTAIYVSPKRQNLSGFEGWHCVKGSIPVGVGLCRMFKTDL